MADAIRFEQVIPILRTGIVARETPLWRAWIQERFPTPSSEPSRNG